MSGLPHVELDRLHWGPDWTPRPEFADEARAAVAQERWIVDGGYEIKELAWSCANFVIWLDYPFFFVLRRLLRRTITRVVRKEVLFGGNRENIHTALLARDSLIAWLVKSYPKQKQQHVALSEQYAPVPVLRFRNSRETERWLDAQASNLFRE